MKLSLKILFVITILNYPAFSNPLWEIEFTVSKGHAYNRLIIGIANDATDDFDRQYEMRALLESSQPVKAYFYAPEWMADSPFFWRNIKANKFPQEWNIQVEADPQSEIFVQWNLKTFKQNQCNPLSVTLVDLNTEQEVNLLEEIVYSFIMDASGKRELKVIADSTGISAGLQPPQNITIVEAGASQNIIIKWEPAESENSPGYNIYRAFNGSEFVKINSEPVNGLKYKDELKESGVYSYYLKTAGVNGCESEKSEIVTVTKEVKSEKK